MKNILTLITLILVFNLFSLSAVAQKTKPAKTKSNNVITTETIKPTEKSTPRMVIKKLDENGRDIELWQKALQIHRSAIVIDTHNDITSPMVDEDYDLATPSEGKFHTDLKRMQ
ncbi:MAG: hypothetical protein JNM06_18020, partial [Blastocatellia bacterium]|nr:hypothetical protein [Blastocatellia bacterium]